MIRYPISEIELRQRIEQEASGWLERASLRTDGFRKAKRYDESSHIWSEIKPVYMAVQHNKCAYCERWLAGRPYGLIEHDVEHFRPKGRVTKYPPETDRYNRHLLKYDFPLGEVFAEGYYLLAYHPLNYVTACKICNSILKADFFPIAGKRKSGQSDLNQLRSEKPWLIYPLSDIDDNPEDILEFLGINPRPVHARGQKMRRAQVMIDFFQLDKREDLRQQRAEAISALFCALRDIEIEPDTQLRDRFEDAVQRMLSPGFQHTNCLRSFYRLYRSDASAARRVFDEVADFLDSIGK